MKAFLLVLLLSGCATSSAPRKEEAAVASGGSSARNEGLTGDAHVVRRQQSRLPTADDFSGTYSLTFGTAPAGPAQATVECFRGPPSVEVTQRDGRLRLSRGFGTFVSGPAPPPPTTEIVEGAAGTNATLDGWYDETYPAKKHEAVRWQLRYEAATQHLVGTRNGAKVTLAPIDWVLPDPATCGPVPQ